MGEDEQSEPKNEDSKMSHQSEEDGSDSEENIDNNCCVQMYFQSDRTSMQEVLAIEVINELLSQDFFDDLRTKQQLGYTVYTY